MTEQEITSLLGGLENDHVEFKSDLVGTRSQEEKHHVMRTVSAFYNTKGGIIIFGIKDQTGEVIGLTNPQGVEKGFAQQLQTLMKDLDERPLAEIVDYKGAKLFIVVCPKGSRPPYMIEGSKRPFIRVGSTTIEASDDQIAQMYRDRSTDPQDRYPINTASIDDLNLKGAEEYLRATGTPSTSSEELLRRLMCEGLLVKMGEVLVPSIAGMLLLGKHPQTFLPHAVIKADVKFSEEQDEWDDIQTIEGTILDQIQGAEAFIRRNIPVSAKIVGFRRIEVPTIPLEVLREAIVNALVHRDYRDRAAEIHLRIRGSGISVASPGGIIAPLTIEIVLKGNFIPRSRNATIAESLIRLGQFMEKRGTGIGRMRKLMLDSKLPEPIFEDQGTAFHVLFKAPLRVEKVPVEQGPHISEQEFLKLKLNDDHWKILELVQEQGEVRPKEVDAVLGRSRPFTIARLDELVAKQVLERTTEKRQDPSAAFRLHRRFTTASRAEAPGSKTQGVLGL